MSIGTRIGINRHDRDGQVLITIHARLFRGTCERDQAGDDEERNDEQEHGRDHQPGLRVHVWDGDRWRDSPPYDTAAATPWRGRRIVLMMS
jgi:hypothetical protein